MNKEVHYEGWLIKSPPTKRIWRARWRRRWFTLKQGEIPEQFCLEYYTDRNCRKLKGVIDLDQCEQVDCGLRLENRKQKFQFMFDIKTPKRTYYLAADTEADMRDWVNCICQVCHLHDTKQPNNELLATDENRALTATTVTTTAITINCNNDSTKNTTTSTLNSTNSIRSVDGAGTVHDIIDRELLRSGGNSITEAEAIVDVAVVSEQPHFSLMGGGFNNHSEGAYVNTEYSNRETLMSAALLSPHQLQQQQHQHQLNSSNAAIYLNSPVITLQQQQSQTQQQQQHLISYENNNNNNATATRLAVNTNGVVRKLPENLVLNNTVLNDMSDAQQHSVQPSPALSTASGPYIPISECFSGSPKFMLDSNNPTTPLNNLDPKFYDTPRSHNNIGLNLTNDQSYSPKITNCGTLQTNNAIKNRSHRSDSDSESVFTDDDEWTHPLPLRENVDRHTRPSDSSVENESFVLTYSQRFSKLPDDAAVATAASSTSTASTATTTTTTTTNENGKDAKNVANLTSLATTLAEASTKEAVPATTTAAAANTTNTKSISKNTAIAISSESGSVLQKFSRVFKNKNNLILDFKREHEKATQRDLPQFSDTENTSPAIGPRDSHSVVEESYDIPRSHNLPYYNMEQLFGKITSPDVTAPIAASTPNLLAGSTQQLNGADGDNYRGTTGSDTVSLNSPILVSGGILSRPHYYTNAAPRKVEGNVFRYDFMEQNDLPPVNRKLKPKINAMDGGADKPPEEVPPLKPAAATAINETSIVNKLMTTNLQSCEAQFTENATSLKPPSVDRKSKPNAYKVGNSATLAPSTRRSTGAPLSMVLSHDSESPDMFVMETRTLPRQPRPNYALGDSYQHHNQQQHNMHMLGMLLNNKTQSHHHHQRTVSAAAATPLTPTMQKAATEAAGKYEHKLQYFDLDVANAPAISRQSISVGNLHAPTLNNRLAKRATTANAGAAAAAPSAVAGVTAGVTGAVAASVSASAGTGTGAVTVPPTTSSVVYNSVDFVKTEAFKRLREERKKKSEEVPYQLK